MSDDPAAASAVGQGTPLRFLPKAIRVPRRPLVAILVGWLTAFPLSIALSILAGALLPEAAPPQLDVSGPTAVLGVVLFAPILETMIMGLVLVVLQFLVSPATAVLISAVGWGIAHSFAAPAWGLVIWWPFVVFSTLFVTWQNRSFVHAFGIPACTHALHNLIPVILLVRGINI